VFTRPDGTAMPPKRASQQFTRQVDAVNLPRVGVHGLRHTWATLALRADVPIKVVSQRIGHAIPAVPMQVYAHALDADDATSRRGHRHPHLRRPVSTRRDRDRGASTRCHDPYWRQDGATDARNAPAGSGGVRVILPSTGR
jgi:integrase